MKQPVVLAAMIAGLLSLPARAQNPDPMDIRACTAIESDAQRLACYDKATGRENLPAAHKRNAENATATAHPAHPDMFGHEHAAPAVGAPLSLLDSRWELAPESKLGTFNIRGYKPVYLMPVFATSNQNTRPTSPNPANTVTTPQQLDNVELKFQLSLKTKVWQGVFGDAGDLWVGYTQSSRWQAYNSKLSRPFRETNYEPEAMLVFDTHYDLLGWEGRMLGIGINHQSNGRSDPYSRSWNRVIADIGFERDGWTLMLRPWWRIPESRKDDNNPDIEDYVGRADMQLVHEWHGQEFGLMLRHSLRGGSRSHGAGQFTWSFPLGGNVRGYMELFKGYGESLIDYNHNATYLGLGISLLDWY
ncbi:phospholipase A [Fulvimonas sp. R45]|uniref:phospholipase A n=1 Tax=Fulvimonas sp. R45 TaxID=3045937 RepID=UPI00265E83AE|nr:phospholipase A [Fulvimonas sp. R45]MDO1530325.1 phospholipase A [Fulvimonas sp. R45]